MTQLHQVIGLVPDRPVPTFSFQLSNKFAALLWASRGCGVPHLLGFHVSQFTDLPIFDVSLGLKPSVFKGSLTYIGFNVVHLLWHEKAGIISHFNVCISISNGKSDVFLNVETLKKTLPSMSWILSYQRVAVTWQMFELLHFFPPNSLILNLMHTAFL